MTCKYPTKIKLDFEITHWIMVLCEVKSLEKF